MSTISTPNPASDWVQEVLQEHRETETALAQLGRLSLSRGLHLVIWGLRAYVVFTVAVVVMNVVQTLH